MSGTKRPQGRELNQPQESDPRGRDRIKFRGRKLLVRRGLLIALALLGGFSESFARKIPKEYKVILAKEPVQKQTLYEKPAVGTVTSVLWGRVDSRDPLAELLVIGSKGAALASGAGIPRSFVAFEGERIGQVVPVDLDQDGVYEFMNRGGGWQPVSVFDAQGRLLWKYRTDDCAPNDMAAGDLDGDGRLDFVVGCTGGGGLHRLNDQGRLQWRRGASNVFDVEIVDANGDGRLEIVYSHGAGPFGNSGIFMSDAEGRNVRRIVRSLLDNSFTLTRWPTTESPFQLLRGSKPQVMNFSGEVVTRFPIKAASSPLMGTPVQLKRGGGRYFAIIEQFLASQQKCMLHLFSPERKPVYQEVLRASWACLAAAPDPSTGAECLLVGGDFGKVWRYRLGP